jgi:LysM repeat protein
MAYSFFLVSDNKKVQFPIAPSDLTINVNGRNETIDLMNEGEVNLLKSPGLTEISFTALIPQVSKYPFAVNREPIDTFTNFLNEMLEKKKPFRFVVVRTAGTKLLFDTNLQVACEGYELKESAENGFDVELAISLKQYREFGVKTITLVSIKTTNKVDTQKTTTTKTTTSSKATTAASTDTKRATKSNSSKKYTIKKGDTLWSISKKYLGSGSKWKTLYNKNKSVIEAAAKKHGKKDSGTGHWIYPGTTLTIP